MHYCRVLQWWLGSCIYLSRLFLCKKVNNLESCRREYFCVYKIGLVSHSLLQLKTCRKNFRFMRFQVCVLPIDLTAGLSGIAADWLPALSWQFSPTLNVLRSTERKKRMLYEWSVTLSLVFQMGWLRKEKDCSLPRRSCYEHLKNWSLPFLCVTNCCLTCALIFHHFVLHTC